uniref:Uncharacterized protein n=1 Tax=viral metagenome TaxID=1070528 RepID=A0A6C0ENS1_9ZZZZ
MSLEINQYLILNKKKYFDLAEEFVKLEQLFRLETLIEKVSFWIDMIIYPVYMLFSTIFYNQKLGILTIMSIHKTVTKWQHYFRYVQLRSEINVWKGIVRSVGGPFISTNDDTYHSYVYADGMQRLHDRLFSSRRVKL